MWAENGLERIKMLLLAINAYKWIIANWKLIAIAVVLAGVFTAGWCVRGYIAEAAQNKAIAAAVKVSEDKMRGDYEKAIAIEKRKRAYRERARAASVGINSLPNDACGDSSIPSSWMLIIQNAYDNIAG